MFVKRIIPCLDVQGGRVVKGVQFENLVDAGDPVAVAKKYSDEGADEICFLDITATHDGRSAIFDVIARTAAQVFVPLTVGGGVRSLEDLARMLDNGADKASINSALFTNPGLVREGARKYGSQFIVAAIDAKTRSNAHTTCPETVPSFCAVDSSTQWECYTHGGRKPTGVDAVKWAKYLADEGAGEILLTSMDADGTGNGFALELTRAISDLVPVPVIASGGVGSPQDIVDGFAKGHADACLAASIFHFGKYSIAEVKAVCDAAGIAVRSNGNR